MKSYLLAFCLGVAGVAVAAPPVSKDLGKGKDPREGIQMDSLLKGEIQNVTKLPQQTGGDTPLLSELFKPTLAEWHRAGMKQTMTSSKLVYEGDALVPDFKKAIVTEVADLGHIQYFYKESLHAQLIGKRAAEILKFTHAENGKVFVSTTVDKIHPEKTYIDDDTNREEKSQCVDILTRITVTNVPLKTPYGLKELVDYWQDFKSHQCHSNSKEE